MALGNAKMRKYTMHELMRRSRGRSLRKYQEGRVHNDAGSLANLSNWHHLKTPWIRLISNAVPRVNEGQTGEAGTKPEDYQEYEEKKKMFGHLGDDIEINQDLRKHFALFAGQGVHNLGDDDILLSAHRFSRVYGIDKGTPGGPNSHPDSVGQDYMDNTRPMPGITGIDVSYKGGGMGALKKGVVNFKCYSLADLERLETFYMFPGIKCLLEWGWSINTAQGAGGTPAYGSVPINPISMAENIMGNAGIVYRQIGINRRVSGGCYDGMFGTITNFSWSANADMSFNCMVNLTDVGDSIFVVNPNSGMFDSTDSTDVSEADVKDTNLTTEKTLKGVMARLKKELGSGVSTDKISDKECNFRYSIKKLKVKAYKKSLGGGSDSGRRGTMTYVRFGDIVDKILNRLYALGSQITYEGEDSPTKSVISQFSIGGGEAALDAGLTNAPPLGKEDGEKTGGETVDTATEEAEIEKLHQPISVIKNHEYLISVDPSICMLPNQIGEDYLDLSSRKPGGLKGEGCDFNVPDDHKKILAADSASDPDNQSDDYQEAGYLANIFINVDTLVDAAENTKDLRAFLQSITNSINQACCRTWNFQWRTVEEFPGFVTCIDTDFKWTGKTEVVELSLDNISGIIRNLSMKSRITNDMMNHLFIAANSPTIKKQVAVGELSQKNIIPLEIDFVLDGISGLQFGTVLTVDYLPSRYKNNTYLFCKQISHHVTPGTWDTNITTGFRWQKQGEDLKKIQLGQINQAIRADDDKCSEEDLTEKIAIDTTPLLEHQLNDGTEMKMIPGSLFQSLESKGLTVGQDESGEPIEPAARAEGKLPHDTLLKKLSKAMSTIYRGTKDLDKQSDEAYDLLNKLMNFNYKDGVQEIDEKVGGNKSTRKKKKKKKQTNNGSGQSTHSKRKTAPIYDPNTNVTKPDRTSKEYHQNQYGGGGIT